MPTEVPPKVICAAPEYLEKRLNYSCLPPGHIFNLYAPMWVSENFKSKFGGKGENKWEIAANIDLKPGQWNPATKSKDVLREARDSGKTKTLQLTAQSFSKEVKEFQDRLIKRQISLANANDSFVVPCKLNAPLATGLGNEHPVENGFSFVSPYGLPYIAGSGVKGALRRAAEIMALFGEEYGVKDFCMLDVWFLFGFEGAGASYWACSKRTNEKTAEDDRYVKAMSEQLAKLESRREDLRKFVEMIGMRGKDILVTTKEIIEGKKAVVDQIAFRGALTFWDAFPACSKMAVEIMTPHYSHYYQNGMAPHDAGQPTPIPFLVVPHGCRLNLIIQCDETRLPKMLKWRDLCVKIIKFASKWQGFGSKTAIGYGDFEVDERAVDELCEKAEEAKRALVEAERKAAMHPEELKIEEFRQTFEAIREREKVYRPGQGQFDSKRNEFLKECLNWTDTGFRKQAAAVLEETFIWGKPSKSDKKNELRQKIDQLKS
jgi:CRISPR-associated protein Cmr6